MSAKRTNHNGPQIYELRINGHPVETSANVVDLYWKARRLVNGSDGVTTEVETVSGPSYAHAFFSNHILAEWERI